MSSKQQVLYVAPVLSSFVKLDLKLLSNHYVLKRNIYNWDRKIFIPFLFLKQFFHILWHITKTDAILVSFGGYWAVLPVFLGYIFRKPTAIILHGTDCTSMPSIQYGSLSKKNAWRACFYCYKRARLLLPVSESLMFTENSYYKHPADPPKQGVRYFFPSLKTPYKVIMNGLETSFWKKTTETKKPNTFISVMSSPNQFKRKGGDLIVEAAQRLPQYDFYIVGMNAFTATQNELSNLHFLGPQSPVVLRDHFSKCQYYFQLSKFEGFGLAPCEAMLCECIPIVSSSNMLPQIAGDSGFVVREMHVEALIAIINEALEPKMSHEQLGIRARNHIIDNFGAERREKALVETINELINN